MRRPYPYGLNLSSDGGWMPVRVDDSNPWGFTYEDDEQLDWETLEGAPLSNLDGEGNPWGLTKPIEDAFDSNQVSISKPIVKGNTGTDPLRTLSSLEQMRSKLSVSDQATLSAIRSKERPQLGPKGTADTADAATLTIEDVDTILKQMVDKLADRDRKTFDDLFLPLHQSTFHPEKRCVFVINVASD